MMPFTKRLIPGLVQEDGVGPIFVQFPVLIGISAPAEELVHCPREDMLVVNSGNLEVK